MKKLLKTITLLLFGFSAFGQDMVDLGIPFATDSYDFCPLEGCENTDLQIDLTRRIEANPKWKKLIQKKKLSISLVDLSNVEDARFAQINGNEMMYAASLPKIAVLLAAMDAIEKGELIETAEVSKDMQLMIAKSDNRASTRMIDRLGFEKIEKVLTDPKYDLYDEYYGGGLWVGKRYGSGGGRYPDPMEGLSHAATAFQVARFYYMMAFGQLVSQERSEQMLNIMVDPKLHHKFVNTYDKIAPQAKLFRKSGSWSVFHSDSIMVWGPKRQYILVALVEDGDGENIIRQLGKAVDQIMHKNS